MSDSHLQSLDDVELVKMLQDCDLALPERNYFIEQMLMTLNPSQRRVIELTFYDGLTAEEIASLTGQTAVTVRNHLYRGLAKLRKLERKQTSVRNVLVTET